MAVIINEFEVVNQQPSPPTSVQEAADALAPVQVPPHPLSPTDVADILCHQAERAARVRAH